LETEEKQCEDIAILTGGTVILKKEDIPENTTIEMLGTAKKVTIDKDNTTIVSGAEADMIKNRKPNQRSNGSYNSDYDKEKLQELY
jgi:chaperonin GroEL